MANPSLNFRLPQEMLDDAGEVAELLDRTPGWVAREALKQYLATFKRKKSAGVRSPRQPQPSPGGE